MKDIRQPLSKHCCKLGSHHAQLGGLKSEHPHCSLPHSTPSVWALNPSKRASSIVIDGPNEEKGHQTSGEWYKNKCMDMVLCPSSPFYIWLLLGWALVCDIGYSNGLLSFFPSVGVCCWRIRKQISRFPFLFFPPSPFLHPLTEAPRPNSHESTLIHIWWRALTNISVSNYIYLLN